MRVAWRSVAWLWQNTLPDTTGALLAWVLFGERLGPLGLFGAALLLGAMAVLALRGSATP